MVDHIRSKLYFGKVFHSRLRPVKHRLKYSVFSMLLDLDELDKLDKNTRFFSINQFNLFSFYEKDHGQGDLPKDDQPMGETIRTYVDGIIQNAGLETEVSRVMMLCYPRIFGYGFNPLTVYYCLDHVGNPLLMIYEVRNTFGEHCTYVMKAGEQVNLSAFYHQNCKKHFYVSPFNEVKGYYNFTHSSIGEKLILRVDLIEDELATLNTCFSGEAVDFTSSNVVKAFFKHPLMSLKIMAGIHWEALKLWRKGLGVRERPKVAKRRLFMFT